MISRARIPLIGTSVVLAASLALGQPSVAWAQRKDELVVKDYNLPADLPPPPAPFYKKAWFWVVVGLGTAAVGAAVGVGVWQGTKRITPEPPAGYPPAVPLPLSLTVRLGAGGRP